MFWYLVELEISIYGKDTEYIYASEKSDAKLVATKNAIKKFKCSEQEISIMIVKKINHN